ncbi:hypothetical protein D3C87_1922730 [compost metagenome]
MGALADLLDRRLGGADKTGNLCVLQLGMVANQPENGVRAILALGDRRVARALALAIGNADLRLGKLELVVRIRLGTGDLVARQLSGCDWI